MSEVAILPEILQMDNIAFKNQQPGKNDNRAEILSGLQAQQKSINPKYFYDTVGSELFEKITSLDEYYPTRTERAILKSNADAIGEHCGKNCILIEPGSGSSEKVRLLLDALKPATYIPMDIADEFLQRSALKLGEEFPWLNIYAICSDFSDNTKVHDDLPEGKRVVFYPGSTLGNMIPDDARVFLQSMRKWVDKDGGVLIGIDLHKCEDKLHKAYNDNQGLTAQFNLNILNNINSLVDANFNAKNFSHDAFFNQKKSRIEMHLVSDVKQTVFIDNAAISFNKGETIHTENSYKYTLESFQQLVESAGFVVRSSWLDDDKLFSVHYLEVNKNS